jgi:SOS response regulatory protein OraA/RecX
VTALRRARGRRVLVELDGKPWRAFAESVVVAAGLSRGIELDRRRLATLARERRRAEATAVAARALRNRDLSAARLAERLARAGVAAGERAATLERLGRAGLVDDDRFAARRAEALAERGLGDAAIKAALRREQLDDERIAEAIAALEPEAMRVERIAARRGRTPATARYLARRGFGEEAVEALGAFAERD